MPENMMPILVPRLKVAAKRLVDASIVTPSASDYMLVENAMIEAATITLEIAAAQVLRQTVPEMKE